MIDLEKLREQAQDANTAEQWYAAHDMTSCSYDYDKAFIAACSPSVVIELLDYIAQLESSETKLITERDHCEEVIDRMAYAVLGADRHEWTSAYDIDDAAEEVEQRIAQLEKDAGRWRMLPAFLEDHQIDYVRLVCDIDTAMEEKHG